MRTPAKADRWRYKSIPVSVALTGQAFDVRRMRGNWESHCGARRRGRSLYESLYGLVVLPVMLVHVFLFHLGVKKRAERHREAVTRSEHR